MPSWASHNQLKNRIKKRALGHSLSASARQVILARCLLHQYTKQRNDKRSACGTNRNNGCAAIKSEKTTDRALKAMLRIFRHYIPKTLVLLGLAELLILFVSIYLGATFHIGSGTVSGYVYGEGLPLWSQALVFAAAIVLGMTAMGLYRRDQRTQPAAVMVRLVLSFACGFVLMGTAYLVYPNIMVGGATFAVALVCSFVGIATCRLICVANDAVEAKRRVLVLGTGASARQIENLRHGADRTGVSIVGYVDLGGDERAIGADRIFELTDSGLWALAEELKIEEIVVGMDDRRKGLPVDDILK
ncbi:MAG: hypothetical protein O7G83_15750, partial [Proteobacteria bacterium]|nr:hypothetical protein [Pseudomonadota bacterium]